MMHIERVHFSLLCIVQLIWSYSYLRTTLWGLGNDNVLIWLARVHRFWHCIQRQPCQTHIESLRQPWDLAVVIMSGITQDICQLWVSTVRVWLHVRQFKLARRYLSKQQRWAFRGPIGAVEEGQEGPWEMLSHPIM